MKSGRIVTSMVGNYFVYLLLPTQLYPMVTVAMVTQSVTYVIGLIGTCRFRFLRKRT